MLLYNDLNLNEQKKHLYDIRCLTLYHFVLKTSLNDVKWKDLLQLFAIPTRQCFFIDEYKNISSN